MSLYDLTKVQNENILRSVNYTSWNCSASVANDLANNTLSTVYKQSFASSGFCKCVKRNIFGISKPNK